MIVWLPTPLIATPVWFEFTKSSFRFKMLTIRSDVPMDEAGGVNCLSTLFVPFGSAFFLRVHFAYFQVTTRVREQ